MPTLQGQVLGTPGYMSPEQARGQSDQVDLRSDVYGLGALLYEILTGKPPFMGSDTPALLQRVIYEAPSRPRQHTPTTPLALEAICLRALAKQPVDRYASASALADDVQRYLADEPVTAYGEPLLPRLARWGRRHQTLVASVGLLLAVAVPVLLIGAAIVNQQKRHAEDNYRLAEQQRLRAEANFRWAREAVDRFDTRVSENKLLNVPRMKGLREGLLRDALEFYQRFVAEQGEAPGLEADLGGAYARLGFITQRLGDLRQALVLTEKAAAIFADLAEVEPDQTEPRRQLGAMLGRIAEYHRLLNDTAAAENAFEKSLQVRERLAEAHPEVPDYQFDLAITLNDLGVLYRDTKRPRQAEPILLRSLAIGRKLVDDNGENLLYLYRYSYSHSNLGILYMDVGDRTRQEEHYERALALREELVKRADNVADYLQALAQSYNNLGVFHGGDTNIDKQEYYYVKALDIRRKLTQLEPEVPDYQGRLTLGLKNLGLLYLRAGKNDKAELALREALTGQEKLVGAHGDNPDNLRTLAACHVALSTWQHRVGKEEDALASAGRALELLAPLLQKEERHVETREILADAYKSLAEAHIQQGKYDEAFRDCDTGLLRADGGLAVDLHLLRATVRALQGDHAGAAAETATQLQLKPRSGQFYNAAIVHALASKAARQDERLLPADRTRLGDQYAVRAVELLGEARNAGYFRNPVRVEQMDREPKLETLRSRADYRRFRKGLEPGTGPQTLRARDDSGIVN